MSAHPGGSGRPTGPWANVSEADWFDWRWQQQNRLRRVSELEATIGLEDDERRAFAESSARFRVAVTPYYASLIGGPGCPIRRQAIPQLGELEVFSHELSDPLAEEEHMAAPGVTHRYPDRVLFYVTHNCPVYCRHCTRKRKVGDPKSASSLDSLEAGFRYIEETESVRDVLVSGGDPLTLSDERLASVFERLSRVPHVEVLRLGTRNPVTLPQRITPELVEVLRGVRPLYVHTHFNHPAECTEAAADALNLLADAGCVLGNQMVLLKGVNDDEETVLELNRWLIRNRCRPYYMLQADMAEGIGHFRTPLQRGIEIVDFLRGRISGMGVPHFILDLPGGGGKISLTPDYVCRQEGHTYEFRNGSGDRFEFVDAAATKNGSPSIGPSPDRKRARA